MSTNQSERVVAFGQVDEDRVGETIVKQYNKDNFALGSIASGIPQFTQETQYTTFLAEYALQDGNIVIHFYMPADFKVHPQSARMYWETQFPKALDAVAQNVFQATAPRLQAKYTEEMQSWWFRASRYDHIIDLPGFLRKFFDELDAALETLRVSDGV